jgi:hypothetical protein
MTTLHNGFQVAHQLAAALLGTGLLADLGRWAQHTLRWAAVRLVVRRERAQETARTAQLLDLERRLREAAGRR